MTSEARTYQKKTMKTETFFKTTYPAGWTLFARQTTSRHFLVSEQKTQTPKSINLTYSYSIALTLPPSLLLPLSKPPNLSFSSHLTWLLSAVSFRRHNRAPYQLTDLLHGSGFLFSSMLLEKSKWQPISAHVVEQQLSPCNWAQLNTGANV